MRIERERAFVLHARPWRETSLLLELFTAGHGRIGAVARGLQGPRRQIDRAALQPGQELELDASAGGELWTLRRWELLDPAPRLEGEMALAGFYVHELLLRLLPRQDPVPALYGRYAQLRGELGRVLPLAWCLRRWERDLLAALGFGIDWAGSTDGRPIEPLAHYRIEPERGLWRDPGQGRSSIRGSAILALAEDRCPSAAEQAELRHLLRALIEHHLGGRPLQAWGLLAELGHYVDPRSAAIRKTGGFDGIEQGRDPL